MFSKASKAIHAGELVNNSGFVILGCASMCFCVFAGAITNSALSFAIISPEKKNITQAKKPIPKPKPIDRRNNIQHRNSTISQIHYSGYFCFFLFFVKIGARQTVFV